jgi:hypothetical protein
MQSSATYQATQQAARQLAHQSALAILARQSELVLLAREALGDANEAGLVVHRVMSRAFRGANGTDIAESLRRDLKSALTDRAA